MRKSLFAGLLATVMLISCSSNNEIPADSDDASSDKSATASSPYEHLKELSWLVGNWENKNDDSSFTNNVTWDKKKNFIIENFSVQSPDEDDLDGTQIIGWDPAEKKIRSWLFDTDGGLGELTWARNGDTWYAFTNFTMPDGRKASATHVYKKINDNTYSFSSENRDIDGDVMPDIGPFTVKRQQSAQK